MARHGLCLFRGSCASTKFNVYIFCFTLPRFVVLCLALVKTCRTLAWLGFGGFGGLGVLIG